MCHVILNNKYDIIPYHQEHMM